MTSRVRSPHKPSVPLAAALAILLGMPLLMGQACTPPSTGKPDLVAYDLTLFDKAPDTGEAVGTVVQNEDGSFWINIAYHIRNDSDVATGRFKIAYKAKDGDFLFTVAEWAGWYRWWDFFAQGSIWTNTAVKIGPEYRGRTISLSVIVDSCDGDEFKPEYCRVDEANEDNNRSNTVSVLVLPTAE